MTGAMYAAIGGLKTHMANLNVIGNNIANVNTNAYKAQRMTFQESLYTTSRSGSDGGVSAGGNNPSQVGYGSSIGSIDLNMTAGTYSPTGFGLDCMIDGEGFFMVGDKDMVINSSEDFTKPKLSRMGDFWKDPEGYICDRRGNVLYGFATVYNPDYDPTLSDEDAAKLKEQGGKNVWDKLIVSSQLVPLRLPLSADVPTAENGGIVGDKQMWQTGDPVYQMLGEPTGDNGARQNVSLANTSFYDDDGKLDATKLGNVGGKYTATDKTTTPLKDADLEKLGVPKPNLRDEVIGIKNLQVSEQGAVIGTCENGQTVVIGYAAIANVDSPDGVTHVGGPYYQAMEGSGDIRISGVGGILTDRFLNNQVVTGGGGGQGAAASVAPPIEEAIGQGKGIKIRNVGLEASTADVATEFSNMILTQRGYQANTRIVTVTDSMLEELVNMKR